MLENFRALVLTYKSAPVAVREQVSLNEDGVKRLLAFARDFTPATDVLIISTCNRTEIYYHSENDISGDLLSGLKITKGIEDSFERYFKALSNGEAVRHLFEVAIGLDAQVIGDLQVSGQVKGAYQWSADMNMAGPFLHRLMHTIFFTNKRIVQETSFRDGAASLSYATKEMVQDLTVGYDEPRILVLGVGEIGQDVVRNLVGTDLKHVIILNRTVEKAQRLAAEGGYRFGGIDQLPEELIHANLVISCVSGDRPLITDDLVSGTKPLSPKFFIDLSVPRSIDPVIERIPGVILYNLDEIREKTNEAVNKRIASIPQVQAIIHEAMDEFNDWAREMIVSPTIQKLKNTLEQIRKEELARFLKNANAQEIAKLEEMSKSLMQKILKFPVLQLKAACKRGDSASLSELLNDLFNLEPTKEKK
jgi:glutamyl-tRNA reductase